MPHAAQTCQRASSGVQDSGIRRVYTEGIQGGVHQYTGSSRNFRKAREIKGLFRKSGKASEKASEEWQKSQIPAKVTDSGQKYQIPGKKSQILGLGNAGLIYRPRKYRPYIQASVNTG